MSYAYNGYSLISIRYTRNETQVTGKGTEGKEGSGEEGK